MRQKARETVEVMVGQMKCKTKCEFDRRGSYGLLKRVKSVDNE